ncbi:MAG: PAS domain S-box protein [Microscillaceae bacterium]|nr:PAS domain S-box protein [Microscillaceae bacterium]
MPITSNLPASEENPDSLAKLAPENPSSQLGMLPGENQFRLHQALDSLNLFGVEVAKDGRITYCNPYFLRITGYGAAEVWGKNYFDCFVPEAEREARRQEYEQALARQGIWENKSRSLLTKAGQVLHVHFSSVVLNYHEGQISGLTKIGEDVSQQHEMSLALKRSNEALQDLFDNSNDLIFICSTRGDFLFANRAFKSKVGYTNEELAQLNVRDVIHHKVKRSTYRKVIEIAKGEPLPKLDTILLTKKGKLIHLEGNVSFRFENGHPTAVRGIMYDITDRIRAEKAQMLYYSIGNLTVKSKNLDHLYQSIHRELGKVIEVRNFYIKLYNDEKTEILFPYYHDEARDHEAKIRRRRSGMGLTDYVMRREKALFCMRRKLRNCSTRALSNFLAPCPKSGLAYHSSLKTKSSALSR